MTLPPDEALTVILNLRLTKDEKSELAEQARLCGITVSALVRKRIFGRRVVPKIDSNMVAELRRLGGLVKHCFNEGANSKDTSDALKEVTKLLERLNRDHQKNS